MGTVQVRGALVAGETCVVTADGALDAVEGEGQNRTWRGCNRNHNRNRQTASAPPHSVTFRKVLNYPLIKSADLSPL
jgi:hypothetical protein